MSSDLINSIISHAAKQFFNTDRGFKEVVHEALLKVDTDKELLDWMIAHPDEAIYVWGIIRRNKTDFRTEMQRWRKEITKT